MAPFIRRRSSGLTIAPTRESEYLARVHRRRSDGRDVSRPKPLCLGRRPVVRIELPVLLPANSRAASPPNSPRRAPRFAGNASLRAPGQRDALSAGRRFSGCAGTCVPTCHPLPARRQTHADRGSGRRPGYRVPGTGSRVAAAGALRIVELLAQHGKLARIASIIASCADERSVTARRARLRRSRARIPPRPRSSYRRQGRPCSYRRGLRLRVTLCRAPCADYRTSDEACRFTTRADLAARSHRRVRRQHRPRGGPSVTHQARLRAGRSRHG